MASKQDKPPHLFERWMQRQGPVTRALATEMKRVLEPMISSRGYARVNYARDDKRIVVNPFEMAFERAVDGGWYEISVMCEKRGRPLFIVDFEFSRLGPIERPIYPIPRLARNPSASGFGQWFGVRSWFTSLTAPSWWQNQIEREVQLAAAYMGQVFAYLDHGIVGPNVWDRSGGRYSAAYARHRGSGARPASS